MQAGTIIQRVRGLDLNIQLRAGTLVHSLLFKPLVSTKDPGLHGVELIDSDIYLYIRELSESIGVNWKKFRA